MLFVSFLPPLEPLLGGSGGVLETKSGPSWMPKQLKIDAEMHVKSKVILSSIFSDFNKPVLARNGKRVDFFSVVK